MAHPTPHITAESHSGESTIEWAPSVTGQVRRPVAVHHRQAPATVRIIMIQQSNSSAHAPVCSSCSPLRACAVASSSAERAQLFAAKSADLPVLLLLLPRREQRDHLHLVLVIPLVHERRACEQSCDERLIRAGKGHPSRR